MNWSHLLTVRDPNPTFIGNLTILTAFSSSSWSFLPIPQDQKECVEQIWTDLNSQTTISNDYNRVNHGKSPATTELVVAELASWNHQVPGSRWAWAWERIGIGYQVMSDGWWVMLVLPGYIHQNLIYSNLLLSMPMYPTKNPPLQYLSIQFCLFTHLNSIRFYSVYLEDVANQWRYDPMKWREEQVSIMVSVLSCPSSLDADKCWSC